MPHTRRLIKSATFPFTKAAQIFRTHNFFRGQQNKIWTDNIKVLQITRHLNKKRSTIWPLIPKILKQPKPCNIQEFNLWKRSLTTKQKKHKHRGKTIMYSCYSQLLQIFQIVNKMTYHKSNSTDIQQISLPMLSIAVTYNTKCNGDQPV